MHYTVAISALLLCQIVIASAPTKDAFDPVKAGAKSVSGTSSRLEGSSMKVSVIYKDQTTVYRTIVKEGKWQVALNAPVVAGTKFKIELDSPVEQKSIPPPPLAKEPSPTLGEGQAPPSDLAKLVEMLAESGIDRTHLLEAAAALAKKERSTSKTSTKEPPPTETPRPSGNNGGPEKVERDEESLWGIIRRKTDEVGAAASDFLKDQAIPLGREFQRKTDEAVASASKLVKEQAVPLWQDIRDKTGEVVASASETVKERAVPLWQDIRGKTDEAAAAALAKLQGVYASHFESGKGEEPRRDEVGVPKKRGTLSILAVLKSGDFDIAADLIERGALVDEKDEDEKTPLMYAARKDPPKQKEGAALRIVRSLLDEGASINAVDKEGASVLIHAVLNQAVEIAKLLIERGADTTAITSSGKTALHFARIQELRELVKLLNKNQRVVTFYSEDGQPIGDAVANAAGKLSFTGLYRFFTGPKISDVAGVIRLNVGEIASFRVLKGSKNLEFAVFPEKSLLTTQLFSRGSLSVVPVRLTSDSSNCLFRFTGECLRRQGSSMKLDSGEALPGDGDRWQFVVSESRKPGYLDLVFFTRDERGGYEISETRKVAGEAAQLVIFQAGDFEIEDLQIENDEERRIREHMERGAVLAEVGKSAICPAEYAECGGQCWGVCINCFKKHCMCYPKGYMGVSGKFHPGASCLKHDGDGTVAEKPASSQPDHVTKHTAYSGHTEL